jgi:GxxExxY protein
LKHVNGSYVLSKETPVIIGLAIEVHKTPGKGFSEIVYKDALEHEMKIRAIGFEREKEFLIEYKNIILPHKLYTDFVIFNSIVIEVKAQKRDNRRPLFSNYKLPGCFQV